MYRVLRFLHPSNIPEEFFALLALKVFLFKVVKALQFPNMLLVSSN
jgi:hypothetical protein